MTARPATTPPPEVPVTDQTPAAAARAAYMDNLRYAARWAGDRGINITAGLSVVLNRVRADLIALSAPVPAGTPGDPLAELHEMLGEDGLTALLAAREAAAEQRGAERAFRAIMADRSNYPNPCDLAWERAREHFALVARDSVGCPDDSVIETPPPAPSGEPNEPDPERVDLPSTRTAVRRGKITWEPTGEPAADTRLDAFRASMTELGHQYGIPINQVAERVAVFLADLAPKAATAADLAEPTGELVPADPGERLACCNHPAAWHQGSYCRGDLLHCKCTETPPGSPADPPISEEGAGQ